MERTKRVAASKAARKGYAESDDEDYEPTKKRPVSKKGMPSIKIIEELPIEFEFDGAGGNSGHSGHSGHSGSNDRRSDNNGDGEEDISPECFLEVNIQEQDNDEQIQPFNNYQSQNDPLAQNSKPSNYYRGSGGSNNQIKTTINRYPCGYCDTIFTDEAFRTRHQRRCRSKRAAECSSNPRPPIQQTVRVTPQPSTQAIQMPNTESEEFLDMYGFHRQMIKGKRMFCCNHCTFTTRNPDHLKYHKPIHGDRWYNCDKCPFKTKNGPDLEIHKRQNHAPPQIVCEPDLDLEGDSANDMLAIQQVSRLFTCDQCSYTSTRPGYLMMHKKVHSRDEPYVCDDCGYKCTRLSFFKKHRISNHGDQLGDVSMFGQSESDDQDYDPFEK